MFRTGCVEQLDAHLLGSHQSVFATLDVLMSFPLTCGWFHGVPLVLFSLIHFASSLESFFFPFLLLIRHGSMGTGFINPEIFYIFLSPFRPQFCREFHLYRRVPAVRRSVKVISIKTQVYMSI